MVLCMKLKHAVVAVLLCLLFLLLLQPRSPRNRSPSFEATKRFALVGGAILRYSWDHENQLPAKLSELVPQYIDLNQLSVFYPPELIASQAKSLPPGWNSNPALVDTFSDCVYLGVTGLPHEVVAYEREGEWNRSNGGILRIIPPGGGVNSVTKLELDELLHQTGSSVLDRLRKQRAIYYEANLHASLNSYRLEFGTYPLGDNISVTKALGGENAANKRFHSSYPQELSPLGENLDPWGTPYFIESDGTKVRIKSAGSNRKFDKIETEGYDDICFSIMGGSVVGDGSRF